MSEYRFTGPFYNDNEEHVYESPAYEFISEPVTPPPVEESKKKKGGFGKTILKTICIALIAGIVGGGTFLGMLYLGHDVMGIGKTEETITDIQKIEPTQNTATTVNNSIDVSSIAEKCMPSVVSITNKGVQEIRSWFGTYQQETSGSGSGIIIRENDTELLIVTNYHVIYDTDSDSSTGISDSIYLYTYGALNAFNAEKGDQGGNGMKATYVGGAMEYDIAVLSITGSEYLKNCIATEATFSDSSEVQVGEKILRF